MRIFHISLCWLQHMLGVLDIYVCQWAKRPDWADDQVVLRINRSLIKIFGVKLYRMRFLGQRFSVEQVDAVLNVEMPFPPMGQDSRVGDYRHLGVVDQRMAVKNQLMGYGLMDTGEMKPFDINAELIDAGKTTGDVGDAKTPAEIRQNEGLAS
jgi:hypothetical protein